MAATKAAKYTKELAEHFYETMCTIRKFEESVKHDFLNGEIPGFVHLYIGEEAIATGVCSALRKDDMIESTHRGHGHCVAKGADVNRMMAEIFGKKTGLCQGRGGSMHIADFSVGMLGANGVVGGGYNLATGAALASKMILKNDRVSVVFFGDGASNRGTFHEAMNVASRDLRQRDELLGFHHALPHHLQCGEHLRPRGGLSCARCDRGRPGCLCCV